MQRHRPRLQVLKEMSVKWPRKTWSDRSHVWCVLFVTRPTPSGTTETGGTKCEWPEQKWYVSQTFFIIIIFYNSTLLTIQHLQYLLTIWGTYATNNTLLYSIYTYTCIYISAQPRKLGRGCRASFKKKEFLTQRRQKKSITHSFPADSLKK